MFTVGLVQSDIKVGDKAGNLAHYAEWLEREIQVPVHLLVFPEMFNCGFSPNIMEDAEPVNGNSVFFLYMTACKFHFTTTPEAYPAYGMAEGEVRDFRFDGDGKRTVIVDTNTGFNDCRVLDIVQLPTPGLIWICGNGCSVGWNTNTSNGRLEMVGSAREPYYYAWTGDFNAGGEIKIGVGNGWGDPFFFAPENNADGYHLTPCIYTPAWPVLRWL